MINREVIIEAIRETAKKNGGVPLGQGIFEQQTGIKRTDWRGIYWARWGDALIEAGFKPNTVSERIDESVILKKLILAIRHYRKLPTLDELRIYRRTIDEDFPSRNTILKRFHSQAKLFAELANFIGKESEYQDIAALCEQFSIPEKDIAESPVQEGHVYLFKSGDYYKIGKTDNLERRVKEVTVTLPEALTIVHTIRTDDTDGIEAYWHRRFNDRRAKGEWFKLSTSDVRAFKRRTFQ